MTPGPTLTSSRHCSVWWPDVSGARLRSVMTWYEWMLLRVGVHWLHPGCHVRLAPRACIMGPIGKRESHGKTYLRKLVQQNPPCTTCQIVDRCRRSSFGCGVGTRHFDHATFSRRRIRRAQILVTTGFVEALTFQLDVPMLLLVALSPAGRLTGSKRTMLRLRRSC
jgi:hypothetical protein